MIAASWPSPTKAETVAAKMRIRTRGLRNCPANRVKADVPDLTPGVFRPNFAILDVASEVASPEADVPKRCRSAPRSVAQ
ncbi:hypothetical protein GCM10007881_09070 [Mesorhizobium huakuii]|nr:hypothetical protein GCM10007881_09070 [Mesorhizobium huakuii]